MVDGCQRIYTQDTVCAKVTDSGQVFSTLEEVERQIQQIEERAAYAQPDP